MNAGGRWVRGDYDKPREEREPVDVERIREIVDALAGTVVTLLGTAACAVTFTMAFGGWAGSAVVVVVGLLIWGYSLIQTARRRAERERQARFAEKQEQSQTGGPRKIAVISEDLD